jgi:hypothetical protein
MGDAMCDAQQNGTNRTFGHSALVPLGGRGHHPDGLTASSRCNTDEHA